MTARAITVGAEFIWWLLTLFCLKLEATAHWLQNSFAVTFDKQLVLPSACFVFMCQVIHATP